MFFLVDSAYDCAHVLDSCIPGDSLCECVLDSCIPGDSACECVLDSYIPGAVAPVWASVRLNLRHSSHAS